MAGLPRLRAAEGVGMTAESDDAAWARTHRVCYQVGPLVELKGKEKVQVGFTVDLYAALPADKTPGDERLEAARQIWERMRGIVQSLAPEGQSGVRVEIDPPQTAAYLRPENEMKPEIGLRARIFHGDAYFTAVTPEDRQTLSVAERKLGGMGLRSGHW
jgi:hypothetical protein